MQEERTPRPRVGRLLRRQREAYDQDLRAVADATRIRYAYLHAIEEGRFGDLPGITYAVGFVRTYADYLGLDEEEIVRQFKEEVEGLERRTNLEFPVPVSEGKVPSGAIIALAVILVAVAYGGWYYLSESEQSLSDLVPEVPERLQSLLAKDDRAAGEDGDVGTAGTSAEPTGAMAGDAAETAETDEDAAAETATRPKAEPESQPEPQPEPETAPEPVADVDPGQDYVPPATTATDEAAGGGYPVEEVETAELENDGGQSAPRPTDDATAGAERAAEQTAALQPEEPQTSIPETAAGTQTGGPDEPAAADDVATAAERPAEEPETPTGQESEGAPAIPSAPASTQEAAAETDSEGRVFGAANTDARIVLQATGDSWVQVRDADGQLLLTRVLHDGDVYRVPNRDGLTLHTGDAGRLAVLVDGQAAPALGDPGDVVRDIPLDPQRLLSGTAAAR